VRVDERRSARRAWIVPAKAFSSLSRRATSATAQPPRASSFAVSAPMPDDAPTMIARSNLLFAT
jgi:hypothetical protein